MHTSWSLSLTHVPLATLTERLFDECSIHVEVQTIYSYVLNLWCDHFFFHAGSIYLPQCEQNKNIPIWLIVFGCVSLVQTAVNVCKRCCQCVVKSASDDDDEEDDSNTLANCISRCGCCIESFFTGFLFVWIIVGSVWVFGIYDDYQRGSCSDCCHSVPYLFSFITLIVIYSLGALFCCGLCCCFCCMAFLGAASEQ